MLKNARNRCQATPIVRFRATTIAQYIEMITFTSATIETAANDAGSRWPRTTLIGAAHVGYVRFPVAALNPRIKKMQIPIDRITDSTKYACRKFDPVNRD